MNDNKDIIIEFEQPVFDNYLLPVKAFENFNEDEEEEDKKNEQIIEQEKIEKINKEEEEKEAHLSYSDVIIKGIFMDLNHSKRILNLTLNELINRGQKLENIQQRTNLLVEHTRILQPPKPNPTYYDRIQENLKDYLSSTYNNYISIYNKFTYYLSILFVLMLISLFSFFYI